MIFDVNRTEFKDCIQEAVWELGTRQLPLEMTLPFVPDEYKAACTDWYNFFQNLLADMYENPDRFGFEINLLQPEYMNKNQAGFCFHMICAFSNYLIDNRCEIPNKEFREITKKYNPKNVEALKSHGFIFEEDGDTVFVFNNIYPDMFVAVNVWGGAKFGNYKVNIGGFLLHCDFRAFVNYKRTYADINLNFNDKNRQIAEKIHEHCVSRKIMPQKCYYFFRVEYKYKGKIVYIPDLVDKNQFKINIGFAPIDSVSYKRIMDCIENDSSAAELKEFLLKHIAKKCNNCMHKDNCETKKNPKEIFGKKMIICMYNPFIRLINPDENDLKCICKFIDLRAMLIDENISEPFAPGNG